MFIQKASQAQEKAKRGSVGSHFVPMSHYLSLLSSLLFSLLSSLIFSPLSSSLISPPAIVGHLLPYSPLM